MKQLKTMAGCLCLCLAAGCTSPASQQENVAVTEGMTQSDAVIKTIMERRSVRRDIQLKANLLFANIIEIS